VIRLFNVYYPIRTLVLLGGEALLVWTSFMMAAILRHPEDYYVVLNYEGGYLKILVATVAVLVFSHLFSAATGAGHTRAGTGCFGLRVSSSAVRQQRRGSGIDACDGSSVRVARDVCLAVATAVSA